MGLFLSTFKKFVDQTFFSVPVPSEYDEKELKEFDDMYDTSNMTIDDAIDYCSKFKTTRKFFT